MLGVRSIFHTAVELIAEQNDQIDNVAPLRRRQINHEQYFIISQACSHSHIASNKHSVNYNFNFISFAFFTTGEQATITTF